MDAQIKVGVERFIDKYEKEHLIAMLSFQYKNPNKTEMEKQQCYERIKELLIELYGLNGILNNV